MTQNAILPAALVLLPASVALAEDTSGGVLTNAWKQGPVPFFVALLVVILAAAVIIAVATSIAGVENRSFAKALKAAGLAWILSIVVAFIAGFCCGLAGLTSESARLVLGIVAAILPGTLAIRHVYDAGIAKAFWAWIIASVLTVFLFFAALYALSTLRS